MAPLLFEDIFNITRVDPDGKKFDKVSRIEAQSDKFDAYILLDVNIDVYPINRDKRYTIGLATTLDLDGTPDTGYYNQTTRETLADKYEYVMHGKTYRVADIEVDGQEKGEIYVSYGGLLMLLRVDKSVSKHFELDQRLFLLMKKTE
uniref:DNA-directed RNA polymerase n=1 Tax=Opuntia streptacantha TaxID=393608 RepID=A0A7C8Z585_OPUST